MDWQRTLAIYLAYRKARNHADAPASPAAVQEAETVCRTTTGKSMPPELVELWRTVAGLDFNGTVIMAPRERPEPEYLPGLVETNTELPQPPYLHIGTFGDELLSWNPEDGSYVTIDRISQDPLPAFETFDALVEEHFGRHLVKWAQKRAPELLEER